MLEAELFTLLEGTADAAFSIDEEGKIRSWNKAAEDLFGYSPAEVLQKTCFDVLEGIGTLGTRVCHRQCSVSECAGANVRVPNFDMSVKTQSGHRVWINLSTIVFENSRTGRRLLLHMARDINERKRTEELFHRMVGLSKQISEWSEPAAPAEPAPALSEQERQVLRLFAEGKNAQAASRELGISPQTLRNHLHHINQKLRTHSRLEAVMNALQRKLI